jgi:prepilin-type N-terminal cleavage/methylation domain-containing protein
MEVHVKTRFSRTAAFTLIELLVVIAIIAALIAILLPVITKARENSNRIKCASNVRQIITAMINYANDNKGAYPRARSNPNSQNVTTTGNYQGALTFSDPFDPAVPVNNVAAAMFMLVRLKSLSSAVFICPSSNDTPDTFGGGNNTAMNRFTFSSKANLSYSYQSPYINNPDYYRVKLGIRVGYAIVSDMNPGTAGGDSVLLAFDGTAPSIAKANSNNHNGKGQNVGYSDGHVDWCLTPFAGVQRNMIRDNIFTSATSDDNYDGSNGDVDTGPQDRDDSVLLPTDDQS